MFPGMNPRDVQKAMKKMGIKQVPIEAKQVIIDCGEKQIIIENPEVSRVSMMGQETFQVTGDWREESVDETPEIDEEDVKMVVSQTGASDEKAKEALLKNNGDIATTILELKE